MAILLKGWILPICGASAGEGLRLQHAQQACLWQWLSGNFLSIFWQFSGNFLTTFWHLSGNFLATLWQLSGNFLATFWQLSSNFLAIVWQLSGSRLAHDSLMTCSWLAHYLLMTCSWLVHDLFMICSWPAKNPWRRRPLGTPFTMIYPQLFHTLFQNSQKIARGGWEVVPDTWHWSCV